MLPNKVIEILRNKTGLAWAVISPDLTIESTSPDFERLYNSPDGTPHGRLTECLWEFAGGESALQMILNGQAGEYGLRNVNRIRADGSIHYYNFLVVAHDEDHPERGLLLIVADMSDQSGLEQMTLQDRNELRLAQVELQRLNAELQRLSRLKSVFLSVAAHDMRSPLSAILAYADLLRMDLKENRRAADYLQVVEEQVDYLNRLIQDFLELDLLEQGAATIPAVMCELDVAMEKIAKALRPAAQRKEIAFRIQSGAAKCMVRMDRGRLEQVLYNLVSNAVKYTQRGGAIDLTGRVEGTEAVLEVKDSGPGMSASDVKHLFELYYRTDNARHSGENGFGLGLYIVRELVQAHRGKIEVTSRPGNGTTFSVRLPAATDQQQVLWIE